MNKREKFESWTRKFYSDLACASDDWSDEKGTYANYAHHMAWHLWQDLQSRLESLEKEMQEQCRIIGMSAERELSLIAKVESLEQDAARWNMFVTICNEAIMNPANRKHQRCMDAYTLAIGKGFDCVGAIDAAIDTAMQANKGE